MTYENLEPDRRPYLERVRDALLDAPAEFGLRYVHPFPRVDGPQMPVRVTEAEESQDHYVLTYSRENLRGPVELVPTDVLWNIDTQLTALVVARISHTQCRVQALTMASEDRYLQALLRSKGVGTWVPVFQAWKPEWELPAEIANASELVELTDPDVLDLFPNTRAENRRGWVAEGKLNPEKMPRPETSRFLRQQREAMQKLSRAIPAEEETDLPSDEEMLESKDKVIRTTIPLEGEE